MALIAYILSAAAATVFAAVGCIVALVAALVICVVLLFRHELQAFLGALIWRMAVRHAARSAHVAKPRPRQV